ncbi:MAG: MMPL family transporter, partial [Solirubrobacteraceae bacterium]
MSITQSHPIHTARCGNQRPAPLARFVRGAARGAARRPKLTIALWLALIVACVALGSLSGMRMLSDADSGVGESGHAQQRLATAGLQKPATENVLVRSGSAQRTAAAEGALTRIAGRLPTVASIQTPRTTAGLSRAGGQTGLVDVTLRGDPDAAASHVASLERVVSDLSARTPGVTFAESGGGSIDRAITQAVDRGLHHAELISVPITLLILVLAFGALVAACVPLLLGVTSVAAALGALGLVSHIAPNGSSTAPVVVLIGLAVGVDYSLFYIRRERAERRAGAGPEAALDATAATVGRAIVVAGLTVVIGLAGLLFTGFGVFTSMALGAIVVVVIAVLGSLTVLPAVLTVLGDRVDRGRLWRRRSQRRRRDRGSQRESLTLSGRFARLVTGGPRTALVLAVIVLAALAAPLLAIHTADPGDKDISAATPVIKAQHSLEHAFPGSSNTGELVVTGRGLNRSQTRARLAFLGREGRRLTGGRGAVSVRVSRTGETALVEIPVPNGNLNVSDRNVGLLRSHLKPATARLIPGARAQLGGDDAANVDFTHRLSTATPLVIAFVLALAFVLLVVTFGSPLLALSVMGLNLLSVGAAFGVLVAVFQHTWAQSLLGFTSDGAIVNWLPLFAFVVLFGLSMDYTVLVLERAAEARRQGRTARDAA